MTLAALAADRCINLRRRLLGSGAGNAKLQMQNAKCKIGYELRMGLGALVGHLGTLLGPIGTKKVANLDEKVSNLDKKWAKIA